MDGLAQKAIESALAGNWKLAAKVNREILRLEPKNIDALNRLAHAFAELGNIQKAKKNAEKALRVDPFNPIATKSLQKWRNLKKVDIPPSSSPSPEIFLEEPGKTKITTLMHLGGPDLLAKLDSGDELRLQLGKHKVSVAALDGKYIGRLADDLSRHLMRLIKSGYSYQVLAKSVQPKEVKVFIRERQRAKKLALVPSFSKPPGKSPTQFDL